MIGPSGVVKLSKEFSEFRITTQNGSAGRENQHFFEYYLTISDLKRAAIDLSTLKLNKV